MTTKLPESALSDELIHAAIRVAKKNGANDMKLGYHKCHTFDGWCVEITVRQHEVCSDDE